MNDEQRIKLYGPRKDEIPVKSGPEVETWKPYRIKKVKKVEWHVGGKREEVWRISLKNYKTKNVNIPLDKGVPEAGKMLWISDKGNISLSEVKIEPDTGGKSDEVLRIPLTVGIKKAEQELDRKSDRFHNPYAFVRPVPLNENHPVWGRHRPYGHDRWVEGTLTGRIEVILTAKTPYFLPKIGLERYADNELKEYETIDYIPATTLKGVLRSYYETITNSCFYIFQENKRVSYSIDPKSNNSPKPKDLIPIRLIRKDNKWYAEKMHSVKVLAYDGEDDPGYESRYYPRPRIDLSNFDDREKVCFKLKYVPVVKVTHKNNIRNADKPDYQAVWTKKPDKRELRKVLKLINMTAEEAIKAGELHHGIRVKEGLKDQSTGVTYYFRVSKQGQKMPSKGAKIDIGKECWFATTKIAVVEDIKKFKEDKCPKNYKQGFLRKDGKTTDSKVYETIFFPYEKRKLVEIPDERIEEFELLIQDSRRLFKPTKNIKQISPYLDGNPADFHVEEGMLLYAEIEGNKVKKIYRTAMGRALYDTTFGEALDRISSTLRACKNIDKLCPACRLFGWTMPAGRKRDKKIPSGYKGRLRVGKAVKIHGPGVQKIGITKEGKTGLRLAVLSSPKPNRATFYLFKEGEGTPQWDNDTESRLYGRKFYWNQMDIIKNWKSLANGSHPGPLRAPFRREDDELDKQNILIKSWVEPGTVFKATVEFENLRAEELGALLAILELPEGATLRIGSAKPFGFGSFDSRVSKLEIIDISGGYSDFGSVKVRQPDNNEVEEIIRKFASSLWDAYKDVAEGESPDLTNLPFIADFFRILTGPDPLQKVIYPRVKEKVPDPGPQVEWSKKNPDTRLPTPRSKQTLKM